MILHNHILLYYCAVCFQVLSQGVVVYCILVQESPPNQTIHPDLYHRPPSNPIVLFFQVLSRGIVVYSILLMSQARDHPLIRLSTQTGGKACIFSDTQHTTYYDCLLGILHHRSPLIAPNLVSITQVLNKATQK